MFVAVTAVQWETLILSYIVIAGPIVIALSGLGVLVIQQYGRIREAVGKLDGAEQHLVSLQQANQRLGERIGQNMADISAISSKVNGGTPPVGE